MSATMNENDGGKWTFVARGGGGGAAAAGGAGGGAAAWRPSGPRTFGVSSGAAEPMTRTGLGRTASSSGEGGDWGKRCGWGEPSGGGSGRPMPAAFGGAERDKRNERLEEQRQRTAAEAERQRREAREKAEADRAMARRMDFSNTEEYPSLGGGARPAPTKVKPALDFRAGAERGAVLGAMREAEAAAAAKEQYYASYAERLEAEERAAHRRRLAQITTRCFDDGFDEYEPPEEEDYGGGGADDGDGMPAYEDDDEDGAAATAESKADGEFNSHLAVLRRRGDKSDW